MPTSGPPPRTWRSRRRSCIQFNAQSKVFGFHPSMAPVAPLYASGKLAVLANTGTLRAPIANRAAYQSTPSARPPNLFSHSDQQDQWNGLQPMAPGAHGMGRTFRRQAA